MNIQQLYEFCLTQKGATEHFPFDKDTLVLKVGGKIFALTSLSGWENNDARINLKCDPNNALQLRNNFEGIQPGFHMNKTHWNTIFINSDVDDKMVYDLIIDSYNLVYKSLSKKNQTEITSL